MQEQLAGRPVCDEDRSVPWSRTFPATPEQSAPARRFLVGILDGSPCSDDAVTCLSELVSNAIVHSDSRLPGGTFRVRVYLRFGELRVEVRDDGGPWAARDGDRDGDAPEPGGRGLLIVAALADAWGIAPRTTAPARTAWFTMSQR